MKVLTSSYRDLKQVSNEHKHEAAGSVQSNRESNLFKELLHS